MKKYFFIVSLMTATLFFSCSKEEGQGGRSSISGTIEGTEISTSRAEVVEITAVTGTEIDGRDFLLLNNPEAGDNYFVWFNDLSNILGAPLIANRIGVQVNYNSGSSNNITVATNIENAINAISGSPFTVTRNNDLLIITCNSKGYVTDSDNGISKLVVDVKVQGRNQTTVQSGTFANENVYIIYGSDNGAFDDNTKTSFDGTFKFDNLRKGSYQVFAYSEDESLINNPLIPILKSIDIGGNEDASVGNITIEKK
jgi:hypothetical protein